MLDTHFLNYFCEEDSGKGLKGAESHRSKTACPRPIMSPYANQFLVSLFQGWRHIENRNSTDIAKNVYQ